MVLPSDFPEGFGRPDSERTHRRREELMRDMRNVIDRFREKGTAVIQCSQIVVQELPAMRRLMQAVLRPELQLEPVVEDAARKPIGRSFLQLMEQTLQADVPLDDTTPSELQELAVRMRDPADAEAPVLFRALALHIMEESRHAMLQMDSVATVLHSIAYTDPQADEAMLKATRDQAGRRLLIMLEEGFRRNPHSSVQTTLLGELEQKLAELRTQLHALDNI